MLHLGVLGRSSLTLGYGEVFGEYLMCKGYPVLLQICLIVVLFVQEVVVVGIRFLAAFAELAKENLPNGLLVDDVVVRVRLQRRRQVDALRHVGERQQLLPFFAAALTALRTPLAGL